MTSLFQAHVEFEIKKEQNVFGKKPQGEIENNICDSKCPLKRIRLSGIR